jgi:hypothetical protein
MEKKRIIHLVKDLDSLLEEVWENISFNYQYISTFLVIPMLGRTSLIEIFEKLHLPKERKLMTSDELKTFFISFSKEFIKDTPLLPISSTPCKVWEEIKKAFHKVPLLRVIILSPTYDELLISCYEKIKKEEKRDIILIQAWDLKTKEKEKGGEKNEERRET